MASTVPAVGRPSTRPQPGPHCSKLSHQCLIIQGIWLPRGPLFQPFPSFFHAPTDWTFPSLKLQAAEGTISLFL